MTASCEYVYLYARPTNHRCSSQCELYSPASFICFLMICRFPNKWHDRKYINLWRGKKLLCQYLYEKQNAYKLIKGLRKVAVAFQISEALKAVPWSETLHQSYIAWTIKWLRTWKNQMTTEADILTPIRYNALRTPQQHKEHIKHYCESAWWGKRNRSEFKHWRTNIALPWTRALPRMFESVDNKVNLMKCLSKIVWLLLSNYTQ